MIATERHEVSLSGRVKSSQSPRHSRRLRSTKAPLKPKDGLNGPPATGNGGVLPGFGDQREIELLVEAGFTPVEAIQIATENGAVYLGQEGRIGTLAPGKQADLVLIKGDPLNTLTTSRTSKLCLKAGVGYDSKKLIDSVRGQVGTR